jgi:preprotein translocase subunit SecE
MHETTQAIETLIVVLLVAAVISFVLALNDKSEIDE